MRLKNRGMTLIEVIVVISILAIITSIITPKNNIRNYRLKSYARTMTNDIRMVRYLRMTEGEYYSILLQEHYYVILNGTKYIKKVEFGKDIRIGDNLGRVIRFTYAGVPMGAGSIVIQDLKTRKYYDITIVPATGRILLR